MQHGSACERERSKNQLPVAHLAVKLGFNSSLRVGDTVYHIQTEDRGADHPFIDTIVYVQGRVLHRRSTGYQDLLGSLEPGEAAFRQRIEQQHRGVIEELRAGTLKFDSPAAGPPPGMEVRLLNPTAWLEGGKVTLQVEVRERGAHQPAGDAHVEVWFEGAPDQARFTARTDAEGCAELSFPLPQLGPYGATLAIRASGPAGEGEIHYQIKQKHRASEPRAPAP